MFIVKVHKTAQGKVVVISDKEIIGKKFEEGELQLDLSKDFYAGEEETNQEKLKELSRDTYLLHLTGRKTVEYFTKLGLVEKDRILHVNGTPHAEVCLIREE